MIPPTMTKAEFVESPLFESGDWTNEEAGWYSASCRMLSFNDVQIGASVMFEHETMRSVTLWSEDPVFGTSWDDYSREKELARHARHIEWLSSILGHWGRQFPWGHISAGGYDGKAGFSVIGVRYHSVKAPEIPG